MNKTFILKLLASLALPLGVGAVAGMFTAQAVPDWYAGLDRPSFAPPNWIFGPVWTALYILMGISLFLVWRQEASKARTRALGVFFLQLLLNFAWSFVFFYYQRIGLALAEIILLWTCIVWMLVLFRRIRPAAAWINLPYLLWVTFATVLNAGFYVLN